MKTTLLTHIFILLATTVLLIPLANYFKLSSVIGYLIIGVIIGPFGLELINNPEQIMHFAEFGVVMMLFLIGLELEPARLWALRKAIIGLGGLQVVLTTGILTSIGIALHYHWKLSFSLSMALTLSSTAMVLQMLQEKNLLHSAEGEHSFSVLLFQDMAVIVMFIILPLLNTNNEVQHHIIFKYMSEGEHALIIIGVICTVILISHFLSHYLFFMIAKTHLREVFTATSLALVVGITLLMQSVGTSPALGAFITGVVLANSEYKHTIETDIEPFKGLLLGLFFISVGMKMNFDLFFQQPFIILATVLALITIKFVILLILGGFFCLQRIQAIGCALTLSQVSEFAFVLFQFGNTIHIIPLEVADFFTVVVTLSMTFTPFLMSIYYRFVVPPVNSMLSKPSLEVINENNPIILAGFGRFGQVIGRFLATQHIPLTILEKNPESIQLLRKFGYKSYFGDASRLDLLKSAGADCAKLLIIAVDDAETTLKIAKLAKQAFPYLKIYARARNRYHAHALHQAQIDYFKDELFDSALIMACDIMSALGHDTKKLHKQADRFAAFDKAALQKLFDFFEKEQKATYHSKYTQGELEQILQADQENYIIPKNN